MPCDVADCDGTAFVRIEKTNAILCRSHYQKLNGLQKAIITASSKGDEEKLLEQIGLLQNAVEKTQ